MATTGIDSRHPLNNADAGTHPLPDDPREIAALLRAGERCYELLPYLKARYGARGEAYTRSDSGFLATVITAGQDHVDQQALWLAGVLANRGMPRWLMEEHLDLMHEELSRAVPENERCYAKLKQSAQLLRAQRREVLPETEFQNLARAFELEASNDFRNTGFLLVSAVCDEACGIRNSVGSLVEWLADTERFPANWCDAVASTLARTRAAIRFYKDGQTK